MLHELQNMPILSTGGIALLVLSILLTIQITCTITDRRCAKMLKQQDAANSNKNARANAEFWIMGSGNPKALNKNSIYLLNELISHNLAWMTEADPVGKSRDYKNQNNRIYKIEYEDYEDLGAKEFIAVEKDGRVILKPYAKSGPPIPPVVITTLKEGELPKD